MGGEGGTYRSTSFLPARAAPVGREMGASLWMREAPSWEAREADAKRQKVPQRSRSPYQIEQAALYSKIAEERRLAGN